MSSQRGNTRKEGSQKYQNVFKFKHNPGSTKSEKIKQAPLDHLCEHCHEVLKWKIQYRKYKPLTALHKCNQCEQKVITKAYRTICDPCANKGKQCSKCAKPMGEEKYAEQELTSLQRKALNEKIDRTMEEVLQSLKERCKRTVLRKVETGEVTFDLAKKIFVYKDTDEEYKVEGKDGGEDDEEDSEDDDKQVKPNKNGKVIEE